MPELDLEDWNLAEPMFWFISQDDEKDLYFRYCGEHPLDDLSIAEYIDRHRKKAFTEWYYSTYMD